MRFMSFGVVAFVAVPLVRLLGVDVPVFPLLLALFFLPAMIGSVLWLFSVLPLNRVERQLLGATGMGRLQAAGLVYRMLLRDAWWLGSAKDRTVRSPRGKEVDT